MSYGNDVADGYRRAALHVARILKGENTIGVAGRSGSEVRVRNQPHRRQGARYRSPTDVALPRRRGDRVIPTRVHHASRRRSRCVAAGGSRAAAGEASDHRVSRRADAFHRGTMAGGF